MTALGDAVALVGPEGLTGPQWRSMLHAAVDGDEHGRGAVRAVYQPIVDVARGCVVGYEALARFADARVTNPETWFAAAHEHGLGAELQAAALRVALAGRRRLPPSCFLTVNVGPEVLSSSAVRAVWRDEGDLRGLVVELTEHFEIRDLAALDPDLDRLRAAGALIAVDDAGSGYAGLTQLLGLRPAMIKLDRALVAGIDRDEAKRALVEMVGTFAGRVDAWLLAEGVERAGELTALAELGVPLVQGYYLGRPAEPWAALTEDAERTLLERRGVVVTGSLRALLERPPVVRDAADAAAWFRDPAVDVVVVCDEHQRPVAVLDDRSAPVPVLVTSLKVNVDTAIPDAAARAVTRPGDGWASPLLCTDNAGRYVGLVRLPRLVSALAAGARA